MPESVDSREVRRMQIRAEPRANDIILHAFPAKGKSHRLPANVMYHSAGVFYFCLVSL